MKRAREREPSVVVFEEPRKRKQKGSIVRLFVVNSNTVLRIDSFNIAAVDRGHYSPNTSLNKFHINIIY